MPEDADYACIHCSEVVALNANDEIACPRCAHKVWVKASTATRVT